MGRYLLLGALLGRLFGSSWGVLGASLGRLETSLRVLEGYFGDLWPSCTVLGPSVRLDRFGSYKTMCEEKRVDVETGAEKWKYIADRRPTWCPGRPPHTSGMVL